MTEAAKQLGGRDREPLVLTPMMLMAPRPDGVEAIWAVSRTSLGRVESETADGRRQMHACDPHGFTPQGDAILRVRVAGFAPGAAGRLRPITTAADDDETVTGAWKPFRALDPAAAVTRFAVWNDTHRHDDTIRQLHRVTPAADFLVWNGDTCNNWDDAAELIPTLLHPGGCDISAARPVCLLWGNHDVRGPQAFRMPGLVATPEGRPFYAFRSGPVAVICLHTGEDKPDNHPSFHGRAAFDALRKEQAAWLAEVIRRPEMRTAPYRVVFCHLPLRWTDEGPQDYACDGYDRFSAGSRALWHDLLVAWRTQVVVSGHTHRSTWIPPTADWPYAQLVGGGPELERASWIEVTADGAALRLCQRNLAGEILHDLNFSPLPPG